MSDPLHRQLARQARRLAGLDPRRPQQGNLRRAVSTAYYALFHFLIHECTGLIVGTASSDRPYRHVVARAFEHGEMARACKSFRGGTLPQAIGERLPVGFRIPDALRGMAHAFLVLQEKRHRADYDLAESFRRRDVVSLIDDVEVAIRDWSAVRRGAECRFFLLSLLTWNRLTGRA